MIRNSHFTARAVGATVACAAVFALAACGSDDDSSTSASTAAEGAATAAETTAATNDKPVKFAMLDAAKTTYGVQIEKSAQATADKLGAEVEFFDANFDPQKQQSQCQNAIATGKFQGIVIYPVDNAAAIPCAKEAAGAGLKVVALETQVGPEFAADKVQIPELTGQVYIDAVAQVQAQFDMAKTACADKNPCEVAFLTGPPAYALPNRERDTWKSLTKDDPAIKTVAYLSPGYDDPDTGENQTKTLLEAHPDVDVIIGDDDSTFGGVVKAVQGAGKADAITLIGAGGTGPGIERIKAGTQYGTAVSLPQTDAAAAVTMLVEAVRGKDPEKNSIASPELSPLGPGVIGVTKDNADKFTAEY